MRPAVPVVQQADASTTRKYGGTGLGPGDQQAAGRADGRHDVGRERRSGPGLDVPLHDQRAGRRRCRAHGGATSSARSRRSRAGACWSSTTTRPTAASSRCRPASGACVPRDTESPARGAALARERATRSTSRSSTCTCRRWTARAGAADPRRSVRRCRWCCSARSAARGRRRPTACSRRTSPSRSRQSQLFDTLVGAARARAAPRRRAADGQADARRRDGERAIRCASCWPRTTW